MTSRHGVTRCLIKQTGEICRRGGLFPILFITVKLAHKLIVVLDASPFFLCSILIFLSFFYAIFFPLTPKLSIILDAFIRLVYCFLHIFFFHSLIFFLLLIFFFSVQGVHHNKCVHTVFFYIYFQFYNFSSFFFLP